MKNFAAILIILSIVVTPCLAEDESACKTESTTLAKNQAVIDGYQNMTDGLADGLSNEDFDCDITSLECSISVAGYTANLETVCEENNGIMVESEVVATCSGEVTNVPVTDLMTMVVGVPLCVGASCDPRDLPADVESGFVTVFDDSILPEIDQIYKGSLECEVKTEGGSETVGPSSDGGGPSGDGGGTPPPSPTSGAQATAIWVSAAGLTLVSSIWM
jgi:hypothetical protein